MSGFVMGSTPRAKTLERVAARKSLGSTASFSDAKSTSYKTRRAVVLDACDTQTGKTMSLEGAYPGEQFFLRQLIGTAGVLNRDLAVSHCSDHRSLATDNPSFCIRVRQSIGERHRALRRPG
jgi:hypothetical protein